LRRIFSYKAARLQFRLIGGSADVPILVGTKARSAATVEVENIAAEQLRLG
jgi:hypothetical protein